MRMLVQIGEPHFLFDQFSGPLTFRCKWHTHTHTQTKVHIDSVQPIKPSSAAGENILEGCVYLGVK